MLWEQQKKYMLNWNVTFILNLDKYGTDKNES